jgi:hypothetical protein
VARTTYLTGVSFWRALRAAAVVTAAIVLPGGMIALAIVALVRRRARARLRTA